VRQEQGPKIVQSAIYSEAKAPLDHTLLSEEDDSLFILETPIFLGI
jgi:hypothetical protein